MTKISANLGRLPELLGFQLRQSQIAVYQDFNEKIKEKGLTPGRFGLLHIIEQNKGLSQTELAEAIGTDRASMVAILDNFEAGQWVERRRSPSDRRKHEIYITPPGKALLKKLWPLVLQHEQSVCADLSPEETQTLLSLLKRISASPTK